MALPPKALTSSNVKMQNCWLRFETYYYSHYCQHSSQIQKGFYKELGNYRPASLTLISEKITESVTKQMDKQNLVKVNRTSVNGKSFPNDLLGLYEVIIESMDKVNPGDFIFSDSI